VLLSDEPVLAPETRFYQRMLAMDVEEASLVAEEFLKGKSLEQLYDELIVRGLSLAEQDRHRGKLDEAKQRFMFQNSRIIIEDMAERADELIAGTANKGSFFGKETDSSKIMIDTVGAVDVLCIPARDETDELAAFMLKLMLHKRGIGARALPSGLSLDGLIDEIDRSKPKVTCVVAVPPFAYVHTRYICRRVRAEFKQLKLAVALLTESQPEQPNPSSSGPTTADETASSLRKAVEAIASMIASSAPSDVVDVSEAGVIL
jgi:hypothetical protein